MKKDVDYGTAMRYGGGAMKNPHLVTKSFGSLSTDCIVDVIGQTAGGFALYVWEDDCGNQMPRPFPLEYLTPEYPAAALVLPPGDGI
jgi:hypothetical protein